jgi:hypothetical protein
MPPIFNPDTNNTLAGLILLILVIAIPLAFLVSIIILGVYLRAVFRTMRTRRNIDTSESAFAESSVLPQDAAQTSLQVVTVDSASDTSNDSAATGLYADLLRGPWYTAAIYAIAGLCYALVTTTIFLLAAKDGFQPLRFLIIFWYYAWPVAVTISLVAAATWWTKLKVFAIYFLIIVVLGVFAIAGNSTANWLEIIGLWLLTNFPATFLLLAFLNRRVQAVGPLVLTFMIVAVTGLVLLPTFVLNNGGLLNLAIGLGRALGLDGAGIYTFLLILGFIAFGVIGWLALQLIGSWYRHKKISEQSITMDAIWLLFGTFQATGLIFEGDHWFAVSFLSFVVYKGVAWAGFKFARRRTRSNQKYPSLLVLRVFALGRRSVRLFDVLATHWRFVGSIQLIAGPDLAATTMEPHEFLNFLSGNLSRQFIDTSQTLDRRISEMEHEPDHDGQFRVNDFFCYDDTWRMVLSRLVSESDVIFMDLRGFSSQNAGCIFEISELINLMPLERVVFITDHTTDEPFLRQVMEQAWDSMRSTSPNRSSTSGRLQLFRLDGLYDQELKRLLQALSTAADVTPKTQVFA